MTHPAIDTLFRNSNKTRHTLTSMTLSALGWEAGQIDPENLHGPQTHVYLWDLPTGWAWAGSVPRALFDETALKSSAERNQWAPVRGGLAYVAGQAANGTPPPDHNGQDWEAQLATLLAAYAGTTKIWEASHRMPQGGHFLVLNYRKPKDTGGLLRPAILPGGEGILQADVFLATIEDVVRLDKQRHPAWFKSR